MKRLERILIVILLISLYLKSKHIDGASLLFVIDCILLSIIYFFFSHPLINKIKLQHLFRGKTSQLSKIQVILSVILGFGLSFTVTGLMYVKQYWYGGYETSFVGMMVLILIGIIALYKKSSQSELTVFYNEVLLRAMIGVLVSIIIFFI